MACNLLLLLSLPYHDREVSDYCSLALGPRGVLHLCVYSAWLLYCIWCATCGISVPRLGFWWPVSRFWDFSWQIQAPWADVCILYIFFSAGRLRSESLLLLTVFPFWKMLQRCSRTLSLSSHTPLVPRLMTGGGANSFVPRTPVAAICSWSIFTALWSLVSLSNDRKQIWENFLPGREGSRTCSFWASLSICSACQSLGTSDLAPGLCSGGAQGAFLTAGSCEAPTGWDCPVTTYVTAGTWKRAWIHCKISWQLHSSVVGCRSFARQLIWHNLLLPQGAVVTLGQKCCCL